jgi:hypothetical protein
LQDSFEGTLDTATWTMFAFNGGSDVRVEGGLLQIDVLQQTTATQDPYGGIRSGSRNVTGASFEIEVLQVPGATAPSFTGELYRFDGTSNYSLFFQKGQVVARRTLSGTTKDVSWPYDPVADRFLRMRHDASTNELVFETRGQATDWVERTRLPVELDLRAMELWLFASSYDIAPAYTTQFDNALLTGPACNAL